MSYTSSYSYDRNANMLSFERRGITDVVSGYEYGVHNSVSMTYTDGGNRLSSIDVTREGADYERRTGLAPTDGPLGGFVYDANGNLICDPSRDIVLIRYNHLNLPVDIRFGNGQRQTIGYDGAGRKLSVEYSQTTHSVVLGAMPDDDDYTVTSVRRYIGPHIFTDGVLEYSGFENGYFDPAQGVMYYAADWQGNNIGVYTAEGRRIRNITYYPYGEPTIEPVGERFLFGGKEREHGGGRNSYDFGARILSSGAWTTPDPLAEKFYPLSPYTYCSADPINHIDPDGRWGLDVHLLKDRSVNGYGIAVLLDRNNEEIFRFVVRAEGTAGHDRMKTNADTPLGTYNIPNPSWIIPNSKTTKRDLERYGQYPRLIMIGKDGEIKESGRDLIRIHGGRQETYDENNGQWNADNDPKLKKTNGCLRAFDIDMRCFKAIIDEIETIDPKENPGEVRIIDDLEKFLEEDEKD